jgi:ferritin
LPGFKIFYENSWKEELDHGKKLMDYVLLRGGVPSVPAIPVRTLNSLRNNLISRIQEKLMIKFFFFFFVF